MSEADEVRLRHMLDAAREAMSFIRGRTLDDLARDRMLALSLVKELEIIGEAASRVSAQVKADAPEIPWALIVGMRNRLIHAYYEVDTQIVWSTAYGKLPELAANLERLLRTA